MCSLKRFQNTKCKDATLLNTNSFNDWCPVKSLFTNQKGKENCDPEVVGAPLAHDSHVVF